MPKIRVMPTLLFKDLGLVKGVAFDSWRRVGSAMQAVKVYNMREVDELVYLDISATNDGRPPDFDTIDELADECFMPLTVGGGVRTVEHVRRLLKVGADKVAINSAAVEHPALIREIADGFGSQCVVVSIDARRRADGSYESYTHCGRRPVGRNGTEERHAALRHRAQRHAVRRAKLSAIAAALSSPVPGPSTATAGRLRLP